MFARTTLVRYWIGAFCAITGTVAHGQLLVTEYVRDPLVAPLPEFAATLAPDDGAADPDPYRQDPDEPRTTFGFFAGQPLFGQGIRDPFGVATFQLGGSLRYRFGPSPRPVSGAVDYRVQHSLLHGDTYSRRHSLTLGPTVSLTPRTTTRLYYRYDRDLYSEGLADPAVRLQDADTVAAGVAQTWHFADHRGFVSLGYEIGQNRPADVEYNNAGQRLNLSGRLPLLWGLDASFEAGYSRNTYTDYGGAVDLGSYRREFTAAVSGYLGDNLEAGINYRYADEDADVDALSYRREAWGLQLRYRY